MTDTPRRGSLLVIFLTVFIDLLGFGMVLPLLPVYAADFGAGGWTTGMLMASFSAMQFLFAPMWGRLSDRIGRRPVLMIGLTGSVVFYTIFGLATVWRSLPWLFVSRIGAGIAGATISTAQAYIADTTSRQNRAKGMALIGAAFGLGFTFGPLFGALALLGDGTGSSPMPGFAAAGLSLVALLLAAVQLPESLAPERRGKERKVFDPAALADALATPSIGLLLVTSFVTVLGFASFETTLSLFVKDEQGAFRYSYKTMLLVYAYIGLTLTLIQGGVVRRVAGRISEVVLASGGLLTLAAGLALLVAAHQVATTWMLLTALTVVVAGFSFITPSLQSLISRRSDPAKQGGILGVAQGVSSLARIAGPVMGTKLFFAAGPTWPHWVAAALMLPALVLLLLAGKSGRDFAEPTANAGDAASSPADQAPAPPAV